jgi:hypothetical protein
MLKVDNGRMFFSRFWERRIFLNATKTGSRGALFLKVLEEEEGVGEEDGMTEGRAVNPPAIKLNITAMCTKIMALR